MVMVVMLVVTIYQAYIKCILGPLPSEESTDDHSFKRSGNASFRINNLDKYYYILHVHTVGTKLRK